MPSNTIPRPSPPVAGPEPAVMVDLRVEHPITRAGLHAILQRQPGIEIVDRAAASDRADVMVVMGESPGGTPADSQPGGPTHAWPAGGPKVLVGSRTTEDVLLHSIRHGIRGFVSERGVARELPEAVRVVAFGSVFLSPDYAAGLVEWVAGQLPPETARFRAAAERLSSREREVLCLLGTGSSNADIARRLVLSETTVRSHVYHILTKLDLPNRSHAVVYGYQFRLSLSAARNGKSGRNRDSGRNGDEVTR